jgi:hypothetical protein
MAVFSGMLIATILGVCLIPMLFVGVEKLTGGKGGHGPAPGAASPPGGEAAATHGGGH